MTGTYQFIEQKYEEQCVLESWSAGTCFSTQNVKRNIYLRQVAIYPKKYGVEYVLEDCNAVAEGSGVSGRLQVPIFAFPLVKF